MFFHRHDTDSIKKKGVLHAFAAFVYVVTLVLGVFSADRLFGSRDPGILAPIAFLMVFVLSAAVMGMLVFGAPVMLYIDGKKKESLQLLAWTIGSLAAITVGTLSVMALIVL